MALHARRANPGGAWPYQTGQDFVPNHLVDGIDFASVHMWPDNWDRVGPSPTCCWTGTAAWALGCSAPGHS